MTHQPNNVSAAGVLLPCPFCGEDARLHVEERPDSHRYPVEHWHASIDCSMCPVGTEWSVVAERGAKKADPVKVAEVVAMWNRRAAASAQPSPVAADAGASINLEGLRKKLLTPRKILRDESGWLWHMDYPVCDEGTRADKFLEAFGIETSFVSMESDSPDFAERWHEEGLTDCSEWTPTSPEGDGWLLLEIYDTEDGPYAMFGRDQYEAENALKRKRTRDLSERIQQRKANQGDTQ